jgi:hypothetical protein
MAFTKMPARLTLLRVWVRPCASVCILGSGSEIAEPLAVKIGGFPDELHR